MAKRLHILAGPNGSGKSTFHKINLPELLFVNPDLIQQALPVSVGRPEMTAARMALQSLEQRLQQSDDFAVETTLSGNVERRLFDEPRRLGWEIRLYFICLESADDHIRRIGQRYQMGGHFIPADVVARRYGRSLETLPKVLPKADFAWLYDNSSLEGFDLLAQFEGGQMVYRTENWPRWAEKILQ